MEQTSTPSSDAIRSARSASTSSSGDARDAISVSASIPSSEAAPRAWTVVTRRRPLARVVRNGRRPCRGLISGCQSEAMPHLPPESSPRANFRQVSSHPLGRARRFFRSSFPLADRAPVDDDTLPMKIPALACCLLAAACNQRRETPNLLRIGYMPNVTHAEALTGQARGSFQRAVGPSVKLEWTAFNAGPQIVEAIFAGALDAAYVGPGPAETGFLRSRGESLRVVAGAAAGGAALVVRKEARVKSAADLHGKSLGSPQLGNTQDIALRTWLAKNGLKTTDRGGDVQVVPTANPDLLTLMKRGKLDGAW